MTKKQFLRRMVLPLALLLSANLCALNISEVKHDFTDDTRVMSFCGVFKVENISLQTTPFGKVAVMPKELGGYKNIILTSKTLASNIELCFESKCEAAACKELPKYEIIESIKLKKSGSILVRVSFDGEMTVVFFVSKHKRAGRDIYRVSSPQDFKFTDRKYRTRLRDYLIAEVKHLL